MPLMFFLYIFGAQPSWSMACAGIHQGQREVVAPPSDGSKRDLLDVIEKFLSDAHAEVGTVNDSDLTVGDFFPMIQSPNLHLSQFNSLGDTFEHSELIADALGLQQGRQIAKVVDFFCGSSIPTLRILASNPEWRSLRVTAVDVDPEAIQVSQKNAQELGLLGRYDFHNLDALGFLRGNSSRFGKSTLAALNPPYLPLPDQLNEEKFAPVDGGPDGTKFLVPFLSYPYESGSLVAVTWSSLSNPRRIIDLIRQSYEIIYVHAYETEFGQYTNSAELLPYIIAQREEGLSAFIESGEGHRRYLIIGTVLRKK
ncbi:MAG: hypothetical protein C5B49_08490 [Bdellovibrio sp.]|nr:MAG: hypothetical protein C5B49_08490 [Bdellovibrio sp.]